MYLAISHAWKACLFARRTSLSARFNFWIFSSGDQTKAEGQDPKMAVALMRDLFGLDTVTALKEAKVPVRCINSGPSVRGRRQ